MVEGDLGLAFGGFVDTGKTCPLQSRLVSSYSFSTAISHLFAPSACILSYMYSGKWYC